MLRKRTINLIVGFIVALALVISGFVSLVKDDAVESKNEFQALVEEARRSSCFSVEMVPKFDGEGTVLVNGDIPFFDETDLSKEPFQQFDPLDSLGRCGRAEACIDKSMMPTEPRGEIGMIKPSGWQISKYPFVDGKYLYNRCHLIGYQLTGENANEKNLITGTRYLNTEGMLPLENEVADYIEKTNTRVLYRVTPVFDGSDLVACGVLMEAFSVEDGGQGICFCRFCYNVQPGVDIDYSNGNNQETN